MQIAGPNLMIAAQSATPPARAKAPLAAAPKAPETTAFEPLNFAKTRPAGPGQPLGAGAAMRPGSRLDITV